MRRPNQSESFMVMHGGPDHPDAGWRWRSQPVAAPRRSAPRSGLSACRLGIALTRAVAVALGMPADHLLPFFAEPVTFLRLLGTAAAARP
ncbi:MAG: hypothetical protein R2749_26425 [Acidimicrobiales bacterium]